MGSHVVSGSAKALVVLVEDKTYFGHVIRRLKLAAPPGAFEVGIRHFGYLLVWMTSLFAVGIFAFNAMLHRPILESFLFALALAIGFTPQLLPAIITINLSKGAREMARRHVVVKKLSSIENFGSMDVFCSDKTGTLTEGVIKLYSVIDAEGKDKPKCHLLAYLNAFFQTGYKNPIDQAIIEENRQDISLWKKLDEIPYDFTRRRLSLLAKKEKEVFLITKGAFESVLACCSKVENSSGQLCDITEKKQQLEELFSSWSTKGFRVLAIAYKPFVNGSTKEIFSKDDEKGMIFLGFLLFYDPIKPGVREVIQELKHVGVHLKVLTGDNYLVAKYVAEEIGLSHSNVLRGCDFKKLSQEELLQKVESIDVFAEVEPHEKEAIILALKHKKHIVGFLGDGINDTMGLHVADVSVSVDSAADVTKEIADIVLLKKDLSVLLRGIKEGRKTFANTIKYIFMATSANFGNMFSMAGVSLIINFLPLLPKQVLLTNLFTDFPEMTIATDNVDREMIHKPFSWDMRFLKRFMIVFGLISSFFDYCTFGVLLFILKASVVEFRTAWFLESVLSASLITLLIRTRKVFYKSIPGRKLLFAVIGTNLFVVILPWTFFNQYFDFTPLPQVYYWTIGGIVLCYMAAVEMAKKWFYRHMEIGRGKSG